MSELANINDGELSAFPQKERTFLRRLNQVCIWLATRSDEKTVDSIMSSFGCSLKAAQDWVLKAEEYLASGMVDNAEVARDMYESRLEDIYAVSRAHVVRNQTEVTTKPVKVVVEQNGEKDGFTVVNGNITKFKADCFDAGAMRLAMDAAERIAKLHGVRSGQPTGIGTMNVLNINGATMKEASAQVVNELGAAQLAEMIGLEVIDGGTDQESD